MYGLVNKAVEGVIRQRYGDAQWEAVRAHAGVEDELFISHQAYPDELTYDLIGAASELLAVPAERLLHELGVYWVLHTAAASYGDMMRAGGSSLREFLVNLPDFHARVQLQFPELAPPTFAVRDVAERELRLHYRSHREGLQPFVIGLLDGLGQLYDTPVQAELVPSETAEDGDVFAVRW